MGEPIKAVDMVRSIREAHYAEIKDLSPEEKIRFFREKARALHSELENLRSFRRTGSYSGASTIPSQAHGTLAARGIMKAIIEVARRDSVFQSAARQVADARKGRTPDFRLSFESARSLFAELTPARLDLLDTLRRVGPCSIYALAKAAERNYSNVHTDVSRLEELGLIERSEEGAVSVPFDSVEILVPLAQLA